MTPATGKIESARVLFRRLRQSDLIHMRELETDPDIMKFTPSRVPQTAEQTQVRLTSQIKFEQERAPLGIWAVELKDSQEFVGWFMLMKTDLLYPEVGYMIKKKHWRKGLASESLQALIDYAFKTLKIDGISARTSLDNFPSILILEKAGFKFTHTMTIAEKVLGGTVDVKVFELIR